MNEDDNGGLYWLLILGVLLLGSLLVGCSIPSSMLAPVPNKVICHYEESKIKISNYNKKTNSFDIGGTAGGELKCEILP